MDAVTEEYVSDDEIFFGKMTLKEVKKRVFMNHPHSQTINCCTNKQENDDDESIIIIETHSEPDLVAVDSFVDSDLKSVSSPNVISHDQRTINSDGKSDDSFIRLEKMVSELCMSPTENQQSQLNNTLDVVNFILNNTEQNKEDVNDCSPLRLCDPNSNTKVEEENSIKLPDVVEDCNSPKAKPEKVLNTCITETNNTPKSVVNNLSQTPSNKDHLRPINMNDIIFKTPRNPVSSKKLAASTQKTPNRINAYQHITSPIASYIKNSPQIPLIKEVHPRKPLPGTSSIPQPIKTLTQHKSINKENIQIPSIAYKSAKKTKLVSAPNQEKLPRGEWPNKLASALKKPVVITHEHRVVNSATRNLNKRKEDSFANLSLQQADISVCTKKSAFC